jgi:hypothetical protein|tara:strand:- start:428 stop:601 length:174 start_codon:yes stop_codon:yes gene_type:complete
MERMFLDVREDRAERSGIFVRNDLKEIVEKVEAGGKEKVVGIVFDESFTIELLTKKV